MASGTVYYLPFGAIGTASQPMVNYLTAYSYNQIANMIVQLTLFLLYPFLLVLAALGLRKREISVAGWAVVSGLAGFSPIFSPAYAASLWYRWLLLLVFPLSIYAVLGIKRILSRLANFRLTLPVLLIALSLSPFIWLAGNFMLVPPEHASPFFTQPSWLRFLPRCCRTRFHSTRLEMFKVQFKS